MPRTWVPKPGVARAARRTRCLLRLNLREGPSGNGPTAALRQHRPDRPSTPAVLGRTTVGSDALLALRQAAGGRDRPSAPSGGRSAARTRRRPGTRPHGGPWTPSPCRRQKRDRNAVDACMIFGPVAVGTRRLTVQRRHRVWTSSVPLRRVHANRGGWQATTILVTSPRAAGCMSRQCCGTLSQVTQGRVRRSCRRTRPVGFRDVLRSGDAPCCGGLAR